MNLQTLLTTREKELVQKLKSESLEALESYAKLLMKELGSDNYAGMMREVMKAISEMESGQNQFALIQLTIKDFLPNKAVLSDIYERLGAIVAMILAHKMREATQH